MELDTYTIDGKEYALLTTLKGNDTTYLYFSNMSAEDDFLIRKLDKDDDNYMMPLDDEEEVKYAILLLTNKNLEN